jgi:hypothetical protein
MKNLQEIMMWPYEPIARYFNERAEKRAAEKHAKAEAQTAYETAITAMTQKDSVKLDSVLGASPALNRRQWEGLVTAAVKSDDVAIFNVALDRLLGGNVNHEFYSHFGGIDSPSHNYHESLLYKAIESGSENIVIFLAQNPKTNLEYSGYSSTSTYHSGGLFGTSHIARKEDTYPVPLEAAQKKGMLQGGAAIAEGLAARHLAAAASLRQKAGIAPS